MTTPEELKKLANSLSKNVASHGDIISDLYQIEHSLTRLSYRLKRELETIEVSKNLAKEFIDAGESFKACGALNATVEDFQKVCDQAQEIVNSAVTKLKEVGAHTTTEEGD